MKVHRTWPRIKHGKIHVHCRNNIYTGIVEQRPNIVKAEHNRNTSAYDRYLAHLCLRNHRSLEYRIQHANETTQQNYPSPISIRLPIHTKQNKNKSENMKSHAKREAQLTIASTFLFTVIWSPHNLIRRHFPWLHKNTSVG